MSQEAEKRLLRVIFGEKRGTRVQPEREEVKIGAQRVLFDTLSNPGLLAVTYPEKPFSKQEIAELTRGMKNFALTRDAGGHIFGVSENSISHERATKGDAFRA